MPLFVTRFFLAILLFGLAGCANPHALLAFKPAGSTSKIQNVLVTTMRAPSDDQSVYFSSTRSPTLNFANIDIAIPPQHKAGQLRHPGSNPDPETEFMVASAQKSAEPSTFKQWFRSRVKTNSSVFVFVHGYNSNFADGVYRHAQLAHDFGVDGVAVHYSWPSAAALPGYLYDNDSAQFARDGLQQTLEMLVEMGAGDITLVAHSMGSLVTMDTLRSLSLARKKNVLSKISILALAAPDVDIDVFRTQYEAIEPKPGTSVVFVNENDRALQASRRLRGGAARVGDGTQKNTLFELGFSVIDLTSLNDGDDRLQHSTFASSPQLIAFTKNRQAVTSSLNGTAHNAQLAQDLGNGLGTVSDIAAKIIYLPATVTGAR